MVNYKPTINDKDGKDFFYEVVLEKDLEIAKNKKEKYKSLALKARQVLSDDDTSSSDSNDEEYAIAVRDFKKFFRRRGKFVRQPYDDKRNFRKIKEDKKEDRRCFKCGDPNHFISDCPKNSFGDQKAFVVRSWSDSGDDSKKEEICLMAHSNEVLSDNLYYSSSSLDNESRQNEYDKNLMTKEKIRTQEVFDLEDRRREKRGKKEWQEWVETTSDLPLIPSGSRGDGVTTFYDGVTSADSKNPSKIRWANGVTKP
ncbi:zf-CCHC domain-containing protein [Tanacetum coccineum]